MGFFRTATMNLTYINIPVLAKVKFNAGNVKPFISAGPDIGILLSAKIKMEMAGQDTTMDMKDEVNSLDISLGFSAGAEIELGNMVPFFQAGYQLGITNDQKDAVGEESLKNKGIVVMVGTRFKLK